MDCTVDWAWIFVFIQGVTTWVLKSYLFYITSKCQNKNNLVISFVQIIFKSWEIDRNQWTISCQTVANISKSWFCLIVPGGCVKYHTQQTRKIDLDKYLNVCTISRNKELYNNALKRFLISLFYFLWIFHKCTSYIDLV